MSYIVNYITMDRRYFKVGDVVKCPYIWGEKTTFTIVSFWGNDYCPMSVAKMNGKKDSIANRCNIDLRKLVLIGALKRPMIRLTQAQLIKLMSKHVTEAKREFLIRKHNVRSI